MDLMKTPLPTWLKDKLSEALYADAGWYLGRYHLESFGIDSFNVPAPDDESAIAEPELALRSIFRRFRQAEVVDYIPPEGRLQFLRGLLYGVNFTTKTRLKD